MDIPLVEYINTQTIYNIDFHGETIELDMMGVWHLAQYDLMPYSHNFESYRIRDGKLYVFPNSSNGDPDFPIDVIHILENAKFSTLNLEIAEVTSGKYFYRLIVQNHLYRKKRYRSSRVETFDKFLDLLKIHYVKTFEKDEDPNSEYAFKYKYVIQLESSIKPNLVDNDIGIHLYNLRVKRKFSDFHFICNDVKFYVHRIVISSIPFFETQMEDTEEFVFPNGYNHSSVKILIKYIYLGSKTWYDMFPDLTLETIEELLNLSDFLEMQEFFNLLSYILYDKFKQYRSILRKYEMTQDNNEYFSKIMNTFKDEAQYLMYLAETFTESMNFSESFLNSIKPLSPRISCEFHIYNETYRRSNITFRYLFLYKCEIVEMEVCGDCVSFEIRVGSKKSYNEIYFLLKNEFIKDGTKIKFIEHRYNTSL